jgi:hypothetical protein
VDTRARRWAWPAAATLLVLVGLILAGTVFYVGWPLPRREHCSGDTCVTSGLAVAWDQVDWGIPPKRISCKELNPGPRAKLMAPGEVCVVARGDVEVSRQTYQELRQEGTRQRIFTLAGVVSVLTLTVAAVVLPHRRSRRR